LLGDSATKVLLELSELNLCPFVGVDVNLRPTVHIARHVLTRA